MKRIPFKFWLDADKDDELLLMEDIDKLKSKRLFARTIREGIRLIMDLRRGNVDVLLELFPELKHRIKSTDETPPGDDDMAQRIINIEQHLAALRVENAAPNGLLMSAQTAGSNALQPAFASQELEALAASVDIFATAGTAPAVTGSDARDEFAAGLGSLFDDDDDDFWDD